MKYVLFLLISLLAACEERYRYPCQDPENWEQKQCKKPFCSANGTCPEDLQHYEKDKKITSPQVEQVPSKGGCK